MSDGGGWPLWLLFLAGVGAAPAAAGAAVTQGPLKGLPSKPGPHIQKIQALGDNTWLEREV